jgi:CheY-like chemotaxis protein
MAKVLLVEDDNNLREIFEMRLQAEGYNTAVANDGEEALVVAMKERPDLIISDVMMPKLSGFEMLETLRAAPEMKTTKVIMMTALGQAEDRSRGEKLGVVKYLVKSQVTLEDFIRVVREVLAPDGSSSTNQESEQSMQPDQNQPAAAPADNTPTMPPVDADAPAVPAGDVADAGQQSAAEEQAGVASQINDFVNSAPAGDAAAPAPADASAPAPVDSAGPVDAGAPAVPAGDTSTTQTTGIPVTTAPDGPTDGAAPAGGDSAGQSGQPQDPAAGL